MACSPAERLGLLNQLRLKETEDWARHEQAVMDNIAQYPRLGCCLSVGEVYSDVQAVAVPLGRIDRGELAAINCSIQGRPLNRTWLLETIAPQLLAMARQLV